MNSLGPIFTIRDYDFETIPSSDTACTIIWFIKLWTLTSADVKLLSTYERRVLQLIFGAVCIMT
uniref:Uncharacterized protein n=1 Tax=Megaselia scalaris TaxID=36166 RepID=T1GS74_MEGSC